LKDGPQVIDQSQEGVTDVPATSKSQTNVGVSKQN